MKNFSSKIQTVKTARALFTVLALALFVGLDPPIWQVQVASGVAQAKSAQLKGYNDQLAEEASRAKAAQAASAKQSMALTSS